MDGSTKRIIGLALLALALVGAFATAYWMWDAGSMVIDPLHHAKRMRANWLLAGQLLLIAGNVFLIGLCLLRTNPAPSAGQTPPDDRRNAFPFPLYLTTGISLALIASSIEIVRQQALGFLWTFLCVPSVLLELGGHRLRVFKAHPVIGPILAIDFYLLYYLALFFPFYRRRHNLARVFIGVHLTLGFLLLVAITLIIRSE